VWGNELLLQAGKDVSLELECIDHGRVVDSINI